MSRETKYRKCPHCKSTKGFRIMVWLGGYEEVTVNFSGKELDRKREGGDKVENYATCLSCNRTIDTENLKIKNV